MNLFRVFLGTAIARKFGVKSPTDFTDGIISAVPRSTAVGVVLVSAVAPGQARAAGTTTSGGTGPGTVASAPTLAAASVNAHANSMALTGTNFGTDSTAIVVTFSLPDTDIQISGASIALISPTSINVPAIPVSNAQKAGPVGVTVTVGGVDSNTLTIPAVNTPANISVANNTSPQSSLVGEPFQNLQAIVVDGWGNPLTGISVTFTALAPQTGASGTFGTAGVINTAVNTNASGIATAANFTANGTVGGPYVVSATVPGVPVPAYFKLTNIAGS
jgi:hypothetical protein